MLRVSVVLPGIILKMEEKYLSTIGGMFERYGIRSVSMDDIARQLGISKKTLYQHFKDKNELVEKVAKAVIAEREVEYNEIAKLASNAIEELYQMSKCLRAHIANLNTSLVFDLKKFHPSAWDSFLEFEHVTVYESLKNNLRRGKSEGFFRADINIEILAKLRVEQVHMSFDPHVFPQKEFDFREVHMQMFAHYVYGILTPKGFELYEKYRNEN